MALPRRYAYLNDSPMPRLIKEGLKTYGTVETPGKKNNPTIMAWAKEVGGPVSKIYTADSIPWCGLWMAVVAKRAGWEVVKSPLWALSWATFGAWVKAKDKPHAPAIGDVLVFTRNGGGHVGLYVGEDATHFHVLGGNQSDKVMISRIAKSRLYTTRRPEWKTKQPESVRPKRLTAVGAVTTNER